MGLILYAAVLSLGSAVVLAPLLMQIVTPLLAAGGMHRYYSRFLYATGRKSIQVHLGNSFDILWKFRRSHHWKIRREIWREILAGLRGVCATVPPESRITFCTWFLSPRKMRRL